MNKILAIAVSLIFISGFTAAEASPLTLDDVNSLKQVVTARMSPSGDRIAYLLQVPRKIYVDDDGKPYQELHVTDLNGNSVPLFIRVRFTATAIRPLNTTTHCD